MAYTHFNDTYPVDTRTGVQFRSDFKNQVEALSHSILFNTFEDWDYTNFTGSGTNLNPQYTYYKKGTDQVQTNYTWSAEKPIQLRMYYISGAGTHFLGRMNLQYNNDDTCISAAYQNEGTGAAYNKLDIDLPTYKDDGTELCDNSRNNLNAIRNGVSWGLLNDWTFSVVAGNGTDEQPDSFKYTNGTEIIQLDMTWGASGGSEFQPTTLVFKYWTPFLGWKTIDTATFVYNLNGTIDTVGWADTVPGTYIKYDKDRPYNVDHLNVIRHVNLNLLAIRDALIANLFPEFDLYKTAGGGSIENPDEIGFEYKGLTTKRYRFVLAWTDEQITKARMYDYNASTWFFIKRAIPTYDSDGIVTSMLWDDTDS